MSISTPAPFLNFNKAENEAAHTWTRKIQDSQGDAIKVFVRVRPHETYGKSDLGSQLCVTVSECKKVVILEGTAEPKRYTYDFVADGSATQETMFNMIGRNIIESCVNGYNGTIFAYGQTGSGKTFTMLGTNEEGDNFQHDLRGIIPRTFEYLFNLVIKEQELHGAGKEFLLRCSFLEIYQEHIYDLLEPSSQSLNLRENMKKGVFVDGLVEISVKNALEAYQVLNSGWMNRRVASTSMNRESSRSHAVFTIQIESKETKDGVENIKSSQLNLVDLAGSERQKDTQAEGKRLKEGCSINMSLSILGNVIMSLVDIGHGKKRHVPYRNTRLTFLLRDSLGGNAKTQIVACIHPGARCYGETLSTLDFAKRAKMIKNKAVVNEDTRGNVLALQNEIKNLKEMLAHFQNGKMPKELGSGDCVNTGMSATGTEWREKFIHAMIFREKVDSEKNVRIESYYLLTEKIDALNAVLQQKDKFLQSQKMIIKFRDSSIARLEKKSQLSNDEVVLGRLEDMKQEIEGLNKMIDHHPQVKKYVTEVQWLKSENKQLQKQLQTANHGLLDISKLEVLEKHYRDLLNADLDVKVNQTPIHTPSGTGHISVATIEKYKSKVEKKQEEIDNLEKEFTELKEKSERKVVELQAELESYKKSNSELQMVLETNQIKSKMEKDALNDKHLQTVKTILTPKKGYNLRSRNTAASTSSMSAADTSLPWEECEALTDIMEPNEMREQAQEELIREVKELQASNTSLSRQIADFETESIKLRQHISKVDHQNAYLSEKLESEHKELKEEKDCMKHDMEILRVNMEKVKEELKMVEGERNDLKVLLDSADKELRETKDSKQTLQDITENKMNHLDLELAKVYQQNDELEKEIDTLQDEVQRRKAESEFHEQLIQELTNKKNDLEERQTTANSQIEKLQNDLTQEKEKSHTMITELAAEGQAKEKSMLEMIQERSQLRSELEECTIKITETETKLENAETRLAASMKTNAENKEVMTSLLTKIEMVKSGKQEAEEKAESLSQSYAALNKESTWKTGEIDRLTEENNALHRQRDSERESNEREISNLREEMEEVLRSWNGDVQIKEQEISDLRRELQEKERISETARNVQAQMDAMKVKYEKELTQLREQGNESGSELQDRHEEIKQLKSNQECLYQKIEEYEKLFTKKNKEVQELKSLVLQKEVIEGEVTELKSLNESKDCEIKHLQDRLNGVEERLASSHEELATKSSQVEKFEAIQSQLHARLTEAEEKEKDTEKRFFENVAEMERLRDVLRTHHNLEEENGELKQTVEVMQGKLTALHEENSKLASHQNPKQKIHYVSTLKNEYSTMEEQLRIMTKEKKMLEEENRKLKGMGNVLRPHSVTDCNLSINIETEDENTPFKKKFKADPV
ncbi:hypothetical protein FSP39_017725 [Pinctada imbricata]|uniref:Kinesin motor domain-containing protein n=1 Tax=Pinctada imbricata TaxID=66713 RepID=A0AA89BT52_PINIB|nr:hypothetical protein FSP39_017725 [Pinctada imbricata]